MIGKICGTGSYVPARVVDNEELSRIVDTSDEWIRERTGIKRRHIAEWETTSYMASKAAREAITQAGIAAEEVDLILLATSSPDTVFPSAACEVQKEIGAVNAAGYDINAACSGFVIAFQTAQAYIMAGMYRNVLVIGAETLSRLVDWTDRGTCILFGDGAGAVLLSAKEGHFCHMSAHSDGGSGQALRLDGIRRDSLEGWKTCTDSKAQPATERQSEQEDAPYIRMNGREVFRFAVKKEAEIIEELLEDAQLRAEEIDYFILHQANRRIIEAIARRIKVPVERFPMNLEEYANTSSATIPILLDEMNRDGRLKRGEKLILSGFGAGLTWAGCLIEW